MASQCQEALPSPCERSAAVSRQPLKMSIKVKGVPGVSSFFERTPGLRGGRIPAGPERRAPFAAPYVYGRVMAETPTVAPGRVWRTHGLE